MPVPLSFFLCFKRSRIPQMVLGLPCVLRGFLTLFLNIAGAFSHLPNSHRYTLTDVLAVELSSKIGFQSSRIAEENDERPGLLEKATLSCRFKYLGTNCLLSSETERPHMDKCCVVLLNDRTNTNPFLLCSCKCDPM